MSRVSFQSFAMSVALESFIKNAGHIVVSLSIVCMQQKFTFAFDNIRPYFATSLGRGFAMSRIEKLWLRIRRNPRQARFEEVDSLLKHHGFEERHAGSHYIYSHPLIAGVVTVVKPHGKSGSQFVSPIYVKKILEALQTIQESSQ